MPDSLYRQIRVSEALRRRAGSISTDDIKAAVFDEFGTRWSVCRPPHLRVAGVLMATVAAIVIEPNMRRTAIAPLPALNRTFAEYTL